MGRRKKGKHKGKKTNYKEEQKFTLDEIRQNEELISQILRNKSGGPHIADLPREQLEALTKEPILPRDPRPPLGPKRHPLSREQKHTREVQTLLLMDGILNQATEYSTKQKVVDFAKVSYLSFFFLDRQHRP